MAWKPFFVHTYVQTYVCTYVRTGVMLYARRGIKKFYNLRARPMHLKRYDLETIFRTYVRTAVRMYVRADRGDAAGHKKSFITSGPGPQVMELFHAELILA